MEKKRRSLTAKVQKNEQFFCVGAKTIRLNVPKNENPHSVADLCLGFLQI